MSMIVYIRTANSNINKDDLKKLLGKNEIVRIYDNDREITGIDITKSGGWYHIFRINSEDDTSEFVKSIDNIDSALSEIFKL